MKIILWVLKIRRYYLIEFVESDRLKIGQNRILIFTWNFFCDWYTNFEHCKLALNVCLFESGRFVLQVEIFRKKFEFFLVYYPTKTSLERKFKSHFVISCIVR